MSILEIIQAIVGMLIGITAIVSLWISIKALRKTDWNSAMSTSPSIVLRPQRIFVVTGEKSSQGGGSVPSRGSTIPKEAGTKEISFRIRFEAFNVGRGVAFNISKPEATGLQISKFDRTPSHQTLDDDPFEITLHKSSSYNAWLTDAEKEINVKLALTYTNDRNNVFCKSSWSAKVKPFSKENGRLKLQETRLFGRESRIEYSPKPFINS